MVRRVREMDLQMDLSQLLHTCAKDGYVLRKHILRA
jgi:hypothetical protein